LKKVIAKFITGSKTIREKSFAVHSGKLLNIIIDNQLAKNKPIKLQ